MSVRTVRTVCPRNCYSTCGMLVTVADGRITRIEGDPKNPATAGRVCLKGLSYARRVTSEDRLLYPLKKMRRGGRLKKVSWDEALTDIAERLEKIRNESGPEAVLFYQGSGSHGALGDLAFAFWHQFGGCTMPFGDLCWPAGLEATRLTFGSVIHSHPRLTTDSRFVLIWGHNPAETNIHQMRLLLDAQEKGATLALVDPRETDTSDVVDLHVKPRPGTDGALALGMARVIVEEGLHDTAFIAQHTVGFERYEERLRDYPLERVAGITGVPADAIRDLARSYAVTKPALLVAGFGVQRHEQAGQTVRALSLLPVLTGNVGVAGGGWQYANLASHSLKGLPLPPRPERMRDGFPVAQLGDALLNLEGPKLRAAWFEKANPVSQNPNVGQVREGLASMELVVVVDQFLTDTTGGADYVLPAKTLFEQEDLVTAYWHPYLQRRAKLFEPPGEVKTESEIWRALCEHFHFETKWFDDERTLLRSILPDGCSDTFDRLEDEPLDLSGNGEVAFSDLRFHTPTGKIEFASEQAAKLWKVDEVPDYREPQSNDSSEYPLFLLTCKTRDRIHSQFGNIDWIKDIERRHFLDMHPVDAQLRKLRNGDRAFVWNSRGRLDNLIVRIVPGIRQGVVHVLEGRCHGDDPDINVLTDDATTDMGYGATFYQCRVQVGSRATREGWGS